MEKEYLIKKWLDNDLNPQELKAFKQIDDYNDLIKLSDSLKQFKAPNFDNDLAYSEIQKSISLKKSAKKEFHWFKPLLRIASIIVIILSVYYYTTTLDTQIETFIAEKTEVTLPDDSRVNLNALSTISFNKSTWSSNRNIDLDGEAYFDVEKGSKFNVNTILGSVTVLGTEFHVKNRLNYFEVVCYEGSVKVISKNIHKILKPGDQFLVIDGKFIAQEKEKKIKPSWLNNESYFKSIPYKYVLSEFERQYDITFITDDIDTNILFTGNFVHNNKELALKSITLPLNITYKIQNSEIALNRE